ncbi:DUF7507 domain-containing protein [Paenibacillus gorillae]|uniref:DUF7507 domain-containing protein n=1 Tax=Paenibacillus gorillae TaxID=1243662 RepID=UPI0004AE8D97|nr:DUF11 domain-containing protein [Paenibacillus gorillae]
MPFVLRYNNNDTGAITFTGNTLGLSRSSTPGVPGTLDIIGAFVTVDTAQQYGTYPPGTTADFGSDSAAALLRFPADSVVLYAELVWGGTYRVSGGMNNYVNFINKPVSLITPQGTAYSVEPDPATAQSARRNATYNYVRSANVTSIIQSGGAGYYTAGKIVGNIDYGSSTGNNCGWTLCVIYENMSLPFRNLSLNVGMVEIASSSPPVTTTLSGFATPTSGPVTGRMALCAMDGDANKTGDQVLFGPSEAGLVALQGPNNFLNNFFASQINNDEGELDTTGTFGDRNQINGVPGSNIVGGRQGWDITNVDITPTLTNGQTSAVFQLQTSGDGYTVNSVGIYIDINSPRITIVKSVDAVLAEVGQTLTYTVVIMNSGTVPADAMLLLDSLPADTEFVPGSVTVNGLSVPDADLAGGVALGSLAPNSSVTVTFEAIVTDVPEEEQLINDATVVFQYQSVTGGPILSGDMVSNEVVIPVINPGIGIIKRVTPDKALPGQTVLYEIEVINTGQVALTGITVSDSLLGLNQGIPDLQPDESFSIPLSYTIPPGTLAGTIIPNTAIALSNQAGPVDAIADVLVLPVYNLSLAKTASRETASPGETVIYTLTVTNSSNAPLTNAAINDPSIGFSQTIASLSPGESQTFNVSYGVPEGTPDGTRFVNVASARSDQTPTITDEALVVVTAAPPVTPSIVPPVSPVPPVEPVEVAKSVSPSLAAVGSTMSYTLTVRNTTGTPQGAGEAAAVLQNVRLFDRLPQQLRLLADSLRINAVTVQNADPTGGIPLGTLQPGQSARVAFKAVVLETPAGETVSNQAFVTYNILGSSTVSSASSNVTTFEVMDDDE